jgi:hypothetical protein
MTSLQTARGIEVNCQMNRHRNRIQVEFRLFLKYCLSHKTVASMVSAEKQPFIIQTVRCGRDEMKNRYKQGDPVVFRITKQSTDPGPRAVDIHPAPSGETYSYQVDKFWTVSDVQADGMLKLVTRRGKQRTVSKDDLRLRRARWWERWIYRNRFPKLSQIQAMTSTHPSSSSDYPADGRD